MTIITIELVMVVIVNANLNVETALKEIMKNVIPLRRLVQKIVDSSDVEMEEWRVLRSVMMGMMLRMITVTVVVNLLVETE